MLNNFTLIQNVGQFDSVSAAAIPLNKLSLIYAENGRGKTTISAILRSLATNKPDLILERKRFGAIHPPKIVISHPAGRYLFENGSWDSAMSNLITFDDDFIANNICSGLEVASDHKVNLHEFILGANGVSLNRAVLIEISNIEEHNRNLREKSTAISPYAGAMSIDAFCQLSSINDIDNLILAKEAEKNTANASAEINNQGIFVEMPLPRIEKTHLIEILSESLESVEEDAVAKVSQYFTSLGNNGEGWIQHGLSVTKTNTQTNATQCPFCQQRIDGLAIVENYRAYFSEAYSNLKTKIHDEIRNIKSHHSIQTLQQFERSFARNEQLKIFWGRFFSVPDLAVAIDQLQTAWQTAIQVIDAAMNRKNSSPLETITITARDLAAIENYNSLCDQVYQYSQSIQQYNRNIANLKHQAQSANMQQIITDIALLNLTKVRYSEQVSPLCNDYTRELSAKSATEERRDTARQALDQYRQNIFPNYEISINEYLSKFNAGFSINRVSSVNNRGGSSANYVIVINNQHVDLSGPSGQPSFKNTLSAGDRNVLALAFFFASIDLSQNAGSNLIVVIDDPMTSLDEHRSLVTVQEVIRLTQRTTQVIVLSHSKQFLFDLSEMAHQVRLPKAALKLARGVSGSSIVIWDIARESVTAHDRHHELVSQYIIGAVVDERSVATALRPILERFMRVAYPIDFPASSLLGPFIHICTERQGLANELLSPSDTTELRNLLDYANQFHHDSNANANTVIINGTELLQFSKRTIKFTRR